jgi:hypothetical protein
MVLDGLLNKWERIGGSRLSEIEYPWRPEIAISSDGSRVAVRAWSDDGRIGLVSLAYRESEDDWVPIGDDDSITFLQDQRNLQSFQFSGSGDMAFTFGSYLGRASSLYCLVLVVEEQING